MSGLMTALVGAARGTNFARASVLMTEAGGFHQLARMGDKLLLMLDPSYPYGWVVRQLDGTLNTVAQPIDFFEILPVVEEESRLVANDNLYGTRTSVDDGATWSATMPVPGLTAGRGTYPSVSPLLSGAIKLGSVYHLYFGYVYSNGGPVLVGVRHYSTTDFVTPSAVNEVPQIVGKLTALDGKIVVQRGSGNGQIEYSTDGYTFTTSDSGNLYDSSAPLGLFPDANGLFLLTTTHYATSADGESWTVSTDVNHGFSLIYNLFYHAGRYFIYGLHGSTRSLRSDVNLNGTFSTIHYTDDLSYAPATNMSLLWTLGFVAKNYWDSSELILLS